MISPDDTETAAVVDFEKIKWRLDRWYFITPTPLYVELLVVEEDGNWKVEGSRLLGQA